MDPGGLTGCQIRHFDQAQIEFPNILRISFKFTTDAVNKSPIISYVFFEIIFEFGSYHQDLSFRAILILVLILYYYLTEDETANGI